MKMEQDILYGKSAGTTHRNTPESDRQPRVWCTVTDQFGTEHQVYAEDPLAAITQFNLRKTIRTK